MNEAVWTVKAFDELTTAEIYKILQTRCAVFVVEQDCPYLDPDGLDFISTHLFTQVDGDIAAYCRITPENSRFAEKSIGRVITTPKHRSRGFGQELMKRAIEVIGDVPIRISAQSYLQKFYGNFGFKIVSGEYLEDDIPHFEMLRE